MVAPAQPHDPPKTAGLDAAYLRKEGALAGVLGAVLLAAWFLYLDVLRGQAFYTPTVLATALLHGGAALEAPETIQPSIPLTLLFTVMHGLIFVAIGVAAGELLYRFARVRSRALIGLLLFGVLCLGFFAFAVNVAAVGSKGIAVRDTLIGNAIAALGMTTYLARNLSGRSPH